MAVLLTAASAEAQQEKRGSLVIPASVLIGLQAADVHSTFIARSSGFGVETNSLMDVSTGKQAAIKAVVGTSALIALSKAHKHHPRVATVTLWVMNGVMAAVVANNYHIASGARRRR